MIEPNGPWGFNLTKRPFHIRVLTYLSDGNWRRGDEISEVLGLPIQTVSQTIVGRNGLDKEWVEVRQITGPRGSKHNEYRIKDGTPMFRPCPWCNGTPETDKDKNGFFVGCACGARTASYSDLSAPVWKWNRRHGE